MSSNCTPSYSPLVCVSYLLALLVRCHPFGTFVVAVVSFRPMDVLYFSMLIPLISETYCVPGRDSLTSDVDFAFAAYHYCRMMMYDSGLWHDYSMATTADSTSAKMPVVDDRLHSVAVVGDTGAWPTMLHWDVLVWRRH